MNHDLSKQFWATKIVRGICHSALVLCCVVVLSTSFSTSSSAQALEPSLWPANMETYLAALTGSASARARIEADLNSSTSVGQGPDPIDPIDCNCTQTFAQFLMSVPPAFQNPTLIASALAGDETAVQTLHAALINAPPSAPDGPIPDAPISNFMLYEIAAGSGDAALITLKLALQGDANALAVMEALHGGGTEAYLSVYSRSLGCGDYATEPAAVDATVAVIDAALAGDPDSIRLMEDIGYQLYATGDNTPAIDPITGEDTYPPYSFGKSWLADLAGNYDPSLNQAPPIAPCMMASVEDTDFNPPSPEIAPEDLPPGVDPATIGNTDVGEYPSVPTFSPSTGDRVGAWWSTGDDYFEFEDPAPGPEDNDDCGDEDAPLTDSFAEDPCTWTRDNNSIEYAQDHQPGYKFIHYLWDWWYAEALPTFHDLIAQWHAMYINQTMMLGLLIDAQNLNKVAQLVQQGELSQKKRMQPNEQTCVANMLAMGGSQAKKMQYAHALQKASSLQNLKRISNSPDPEAGSARGTAQDLASRWDRYCNDFVDPEANAGENACPNPTREGNIMDGDVKVESFLFRDTIDLSLAEERRAAASMVANLISPHVKDPYLKYTDPSDQEAILYDQHLQAVRTFATSIVAAMYSRRAAILEVDTDVARQIRDIRRKAGIPDERISDLPSYNEVMQTMTKVRFMVPNYYIQMAKNEGEMKQEQNSVASYISIQLQDIYTLQEQINSLLAIKGAMELKQSPTPDYLNALPQAP